LVAYHDRVGVRVDRDHGSAEPGVLADRRQTDPAAGDRGAHPRWAADVAGPVVVGLTAPNAFGISFGCTTSPVADQIAADPSAYYVNVHTVDFPAGAVRGQLG
jgi:hypothetical protein